jgi:flagellar motility protein MotE (MotC chaperone)
MNRIIEIVAMVLGGLSIFIVCFVGFVAMSGKPVSQIAVIGGLFPAAHPPESGQEAGHDGGGTHEAAAIDTRGGDQSHMSDSAVIESSLGILSAWTLPSPYSTSELRQLSAEIKQRHEELEAREQALARRERAVQDDERGLDERRESLEGLRKHLESLQKEIVLQEQALDRKVEVSQAGENARWAEVARVIAGLENEEAGKRIQEYGAAEAAKILQAIGDESRAGEILNQVPGASWKEFVDAYTAEKARTTSRK